jgi:1,4-dihydroxy-2-naphthoyl-CoA synthase
MNRLSCTFALARSATLAATPRPTLVHFARAMSQSTAAAASQGEQLVLSEKKGNVLVLTLNRPKALNALSSPLFEQLNGAFAKAQVDDEVRAVVLTGGEKNFAGESRSEGW